MRGSASSVAHPRTYTVSGCLYQKLYRAGLVQTAEVEDILYPSMNVFK